MEKKEALQILLSMREFCSYTLLNVKSEVSKTAYKKYIEAIDVVFENVNKNE